MRTDKIASATTGPRAVRSDRRRRAHLRELCDEVLASFRLASGRDPISEQDRLAARELMPQLVTMRK
jgi:hypothetical protein